ncbi:hypothetical protein LguiB_026085 [Lonicera macranthoides]
MLGCSIEGIDLKECLDDGKMSVSDSCCRVLNEALQDGFYCFCLVLQSSNSPLLTSPISVPLSNCYISVPSVTQCQAPMTKQRPPASPEEELTQPPPSRENLLAPTTLQAGLP